MHLLDLYFIAFRNHSNVTSLIATDCIYIWRWKNVDYDSPIFYPKSLCNLTSISPDSTSRSDKRLWPSLRSSNKSLTFLPA